jgi:hypothetical protein
MVKLASGYSFRHLDGITQGCGKTEELRPRSVMSTYTINPANHICHVGSEKTGVYVGLVQDDKPKAFEESLPASMAREHAHMNHLGIRYQHARGLARAPSGRCAGIGIERHGHQFPWLAGALQCTHAGIPGSHLVSCKSFRRKDQECRRIRIIKESFKNWHLVTEALAAGRRSGNNKVFSTDGCRDRVGLVSVKPINTKSA